MKLNFWQWLGVVLLVLAGGFWLFEKGRSGTPATNTPAPSSQPATR